MRTGAEKAGLVACRAEEDRASRVPPAYSLYCVTGDTLRGFPSRIPIGMIFVDVEKLVGSRRQSCSFCLHCCWRSAGGLYRRKAVRSAAVSHQFDAYSPSFAFCVLFSGQCRLLSSGASLCRNRWAFGLLHASDCFRWRYDRRLGRHLFHQAVTRNVSKVAI